MSGLGWMLGTNLALISKCLMTFQEGHVVLGIFGIHAGWIAPGVIGR
jgi:hypothetical protein